MAVNVNGQPLSFVATLDDKDFNKVSERIKAEIGSVTKAVAQQQTEITGLVKIAAGFFTVNAAKDFITQIVKIRGEFQQLEAAFGVMLKSKAKADDLMKNLVQFAATTPFGLQETANAAKQLLAYGSNASSVTGELRMLGDVAAGVGAPMGDIVYLYGTLRTQGRAFTQDIRQFAGRGIPIYEELAKVLGVAQDKIDDMVQAGKVGFPQIQKAFQNMTGEGGKFSGTMDAMSKTIAGQISNIQDSLAQMFNKIGEDSEGAISAGLSGVSYLISHYEEIGKVLAVLIATYGAYRAALIITAVATRGTAIAQTFLTNATLIADKAMKLLNTTLLANPFAAVAAAAALLITSLALFNKHAEIGKTKAQLLADANEKMGDKMAETRAKIEPYLQALNKANVTEAERAKIYGELQKIDPKIVAGLDAKTLSYQKLSVSINTYLANLRQQLKLEANRDAVVESYKQEDAIEKQLKAAKQQQDKDNKALEELRKSNNGFAMQGYAGMAMAADRSKIKVGELVIALNKQRDQTKQLEDETRELNKVTTDPAPIKNYAYWTKQAEEAEKVIEELDATQQSGSDKWKEQKALYQDAKKHLEAYNLSTTATQKAEDKYNAIIDKKKKVLEDIAQSQADYNKRFLSDTDAQKAAIDERYDAEIKKILETNKEIANYNKTVGPGRQVALTSQEVIDERNRSRNSEKADVDTTAAAKLEIEAIKDKKAAYDEYNRAVADGNTLLAQHLKEQTNGKFESYLKYIESEYAKLATKFGEVGARGMTEGERQKMKALGEMLKEETKDAQGKAVERYSQNITKMIEATNDFDRQRRESEKNYNAVLMTLEAERTKLGEVEYKRRLDALNAYRAEELTQERLTLWQNSDVYKTINTDLTLFTKEQLANRLDLLKKFLKEGTYLTSDGKTKQLTPEMLALLKKAIEAAENGVKWFTGMSDKTRETLKEAAKWMGIAAAGFNDLASAIGDSNEGLADTLSTAGQLLGMAADVATAVVSGNPVAIVQAGVKAVASVVKMFGDAKKSLIEAQRKVQEFQDQQFINEFKVNELYRQRLLMKADEIELTLAHINAQKQALLLTQQQAKQDESNLLAALQQQQYITGVTTEKYGGFLGLARKTRAVNQYGSLLGMTYEQIEKLYTSNQLDGKAKDLFEQLKKVHEEGADVDKQLRELQKQAAEVWTGTTADNILDSLTQGFSDGLKTAADFADNFQYLMRNAMENALKYKYLEPAIADFYKQFSEFAQSDAVLTASEIDELKRQYNAMIADVGKQFDQLQQVTGMTVGSTQSNSNSLSGAIKGMTEQQAELLAGQFGGMRMTAIDQLNIATRSLQVHQQIEANTRRLHEIGDLLRRVELNGLKVK